MATPIPNTQEILPFATIRDGVVILKNGELRQIISVASVNFGLKSEREQMAIIYQFQGFLNSLSFPIQILMQSRKLDLSQYLKTLEERQAQETNELIRFQILEYSEFIKRLISLANIMDKKFYLIIPFVPTSTEAKVKGLSGLFGKKDVHPQLSMQEFENYKRDLGERINTVTSGLAACGLRSETLTTQKLIELLYASYNQEEAYTEKLASVEELESPVVHSAEEKPKEDQLI